MSSSHLTAILILRDPNGVIHYKGYTSSEVYNSDANNFEDLENVQYNTFMNKVYQEIGYSVQNHNNSTFFGNLLECHVRKVKINNYNDTTTLYFSVYENEFTDYLCVHRNSPIFFDPIEASNYSSVQTELVHVNCNNQII